MADPLPPLLKRADGRLPDQIRPVGFHWDPDGFALRSLTVQTGRTRVLCSVCVEDRVPTWRRGSGSG